ncbi:ribonuclease HII [Apilactobacillus apisilvae]|uniref:Ribonuclease HII n=1 Tax=Apilactobacillus apisilvae TaxID=2923364 RepID=A0ABY4PHU7_9LACO|nr:ribonuclease HII [Apilactobacillus apisilvae]UQS85406.1 ribonuclease HII [Apilactobacillus apisilvae]
MNNQLSIKKITELLSNANSLSDSIFNEYQLDSRKGVQLALKRRKKHLLKIHDEKVDFHKRLRYENHFWNNGIKYVAGVDEVGRGPLAGPVVTAAVILPNDFELYEVNDSKKLSPKKRLELSELIKQNALYYNIGIASNKIIDQINIYEATRSAMKDAIDGLSVTPKEIIVDAMNIDVPIHQTRLIKGDAKSASVSAASIIAKVYRDNLMDEYNNQYPEYDFNHNSGYGTKNHLYALKKYGATPIHRKTFKPVSDIIGD